MIIIKEKKKHSSKPTQTQEPQQNTQAPTKPENTADVVAQGSVTLIMFKTSNGKVPFQEYMDSIQKLHNKPLRKSIEDDLDKLARMGTEAHSKLAKPLRNGIYELRTKCGTCYSRIFYFTKGNRFYLLNGYLKDDKKMNTNEFDKAVEYKKDYDESLKEAKMYKEEFEQRGTMLTEDVNGNILDADGRVIGIPLSEWFKRNPMED